MSTHTPGPWWVASELPLRVSGDFEIISGTGHIAIATSHNAPIIAAAPDMLAACQEWLDLWLYIREHYPDIELPCTLDFATGTDACGRLRIAIGKAKGLRR